MKNDRWMLYGATGYTGCLIAAEAVRRGHRPILAGRSAEKLAPMAESLGLEHTAFSLDDSTAIAHAVADVELVLHAAGPFIYTAEPMQRACLDTNTHYLDITGEYPVFENIFSYSKPAQNIVLISGVGFDVVPSDCLAVYVAQQVPKAVQLDIAISTLTRISAGTAQSGIGLAARGGLVRQDGELVSYPLGAGGKQVHFPNGSRFAIPIPWGDLSTAYRSTGIPNITTYMTFPRALARLAQVILPFAQPFLGLRAVQDFLIGIMPKPKTVGGAFVWARATAADGHYAEAWIETPEVYAFTAACAVQAVERVFADRPTGVLTPAEAFGVDFPLTIPGTRRIG